MLVEIALIMVLLVCFLRGGELHSFLVLEAQRIFRHASFQTDQEAPRRLPDGRMDFVDLLVQRQELMLCVEAETSARNVTSNVIKAEQLGIAVWVLVPSRKVQKAVKAKLQDLGIRPGGRRIKILLLRQLEQELTNCFPFNPSANGPEEKQENRKTDK